MANLIVHFVGHPSEGRVKITDDVRDRRHATLINISEPAI